MIVIKVKLYGEKGKEQLEVLSKELLANVNKYCASVKEPYLYEVERYLLGIAKENIISVTEEERETNP